MDQKKPTIGTLEWEMQNLSKTDAPELTGAQNNLANELVAKLSPSLKTSAVTLTEAHRNLASEIFKAFTLGMSSLDAAQLIAKSEARAVARWSGGLDQSLPDLYEAAKAERDQLRALIGTPPERSHPDEQHPRAQTWHQERLNWIAEVKRLRAEVARLTELSGNQASAIKWAKDQMTAENHD